MTSALRAFVDRLVAIRHELSRFAVVGVLSLLVDLAVFNLLRDTVLPDKPLTAKVISALVSTTNAFVLNRHWSFRARTRSALHREYAQFIVINAIGLGISLVCLAVSHYGLGLEGRLADNISANGIGLVLGTMFRFWAYRHFIWAAPVGEDQPVAEEDDLAERVP